MGVGLGGDDPAADGPVEEADAHEEGLVDALDRVLVLVDGRGDRPDADRAAAEVLDDGREDLAVDVVEAEDVDLHHVQGPLGFLDRDDAAALDVDVVADAAQQPVGHARRSPRAQGDLAGPGLVDLDLEDPGRALDDPLQVLVPVVVEAVDDAEAAAQGRRDAAGPGRRPDQGELLDLELVAAGARPLADEDVHVEILHGRVEDLLDRGLEAVDLVDEQDLFGLHVGQDGREVAGPLDDRPGRGLDADAHLLGDEVGQARLAQSRGPVEEDVVELLVAFAGRLDEDAQVGLDLVLADELVERLRAEAILEEDVLFRPDRAEDGGHAVS